jgi:hypothetical protein
VTTEEIIKLMREKTDAMQRERERIVNFIEVLEDTYRSNGELKSASTCRSIIEHLRYS